jgi:hypothetical protein
VWWYSPARDETSQHKLVEGAPSHAEGAPSHAEGAPSHAEGAPSHAEGAPSHESDEKRVFEPTSPESPAPREGGLGRPAIQSTPRLDSTQLDAPSRDLGSLVTPSHGMTEQEVALLKSRAITQVTPGHWMHTRKQADGTIVLTPVRAQQVLKAL